MTGESPIYRMLRKARMAAMRKECTLQSDTNGPKPTLAKTFGAAVQLSKSRHRRNKEASRALGGSGALVSSHFAQSVSSKKHQYIQFMS
jgi:hypothetical protein